MAKREKAAWFKVFLHHKPFINEMTDEELGRAYRAAMEYFDNQTEIPLERAERFLFMMMKEHIDEAIADYENKKANGKKGGRPKNQNKPEVTSAFSEKADETEADADAEAEAEVEAEAETEADAETEEKEEYAKKEKMCLCSDGEHTQFSPPKLEEVQAYIQNCGYRMDPTVFWDYYTANGWHMGTAPIRDWKAAVRNWNRKEHTNGKAGSDHKPAHERWTVGVTL